MTLDRARWEMIEAGGRTAQSFGLSRLFGQIFVLLYLSPKPLCLDEVARLLGVSKASVSIGCRQLESWGAVRLVAIEGDRRDFYEAESDLGTMLRGGLLSSFNKKLDSAGVQIRRSASLVDDKELGDDDAQFLRRRLAEAESKRDKVQRLLNNPIVKKLLS